MKLQLFDGSDGDSMLLTATSGHHVLFDGGRKTQFRANALPQLAKLEQIDLVCVSHIDNDHIQGVVELVDNRIQQARVAHQRGTGNNNGDPLEHPAPPVLEFWHNAFHHMVDDTDGSVRTALAQHQRVFSSFRNRDGRLNMLGEQVVPSLDLPGLDYLDDVDNLATGFKEGIELSLKISPERLNIPVNADFKKFVERGTDASPPVKKVGSLTLEVLSPTSAELADFKSKWTEWVGANQIRIADLVKDIDSLLLSTDSATPRIAEAAKRSKVTPQNRVSIVAMVIEGQVKALFTGDADQDSIIKGLESSSHLDQTAPDGTTAGHLNLLKVQHHGSPKNLDERFTRRVSADHYVFCGNGSHHGLPSLKVINHVLDSRLLGSGSNDAVLTKEKDKPFHLWFTAHPDRLPKASTARRDHMKSVLDLVEKRMNDNPNRFGATVLRKSGDVTISVDSCKAVKPSIIEV